jgi:hypothetical protein
MNENFVTYFDSNYLIQGICLYFSLERHIDNFTLWVVCVDEKAYETLSKLNFRSIKLIRLSDVETEELLIAKSNRSIGEYCWTITPYVPDFVFKIDENINRVTYLDADLWFRKSPLIIIRDFLDSEKGILITDHSFSYQHDYSNKAGQYCVQFITFKKNNAVHIRRRWQRQCVDWCYNKYDNGKFGDQKYLDEWPVLYPNDIHVMSNKEWALAPWNITRFPYGNSVFYHFHQLKIINKNFCYFGNYELPNNIRQEIYMSYVNDIKMAFELLDENDVDVSYLNVSLIKYLAVNLMDIIKKVIKKMLLMINLNVSRI